MLLGFLLCFGYAVFCWLVFFKFRWIQFSIAWGVVTVVVGIHLLLIFMIGLRFVTPVFDGSQDDPAHHPTDAALVRADARHGGSGGAERPCQEKDAAVPVRPQCLRIQGDTSSSPNSPEASRASWY